MFSLHWIETMINRCCYRWSHFGWAELVIWDVISLISNNLRERYYELQCMPHTNLKETCCRYDSTLFILILLWPIWCHHHIYSRTTAPTFTSNRVPCWLPQNFWFQDFWMIWKNDLKETPGWDVMLVKQCHKRTIPQSSPFLIIFIGGMFSIPSHWW